MGDAITDVLLCDGKNLGFGISLATNNADGRSHAEQRRDAYLLHGTKKPMQPKHATNSEL
jgi:hypothetical protein